MTQYTIFDVIVDEAIQQLLDVMNQNRKPKNKLRLLHKSKFGDWNIIAVLIDDEIYYNILDNNGKFPEGLGACFRKFELVIRDFKDGLIPECIIRLKLFELNTRLLNQGKTWKEIEKFWDEIFKELKA